MPADQDLLFGKIAVELKFCTAKQVEECLKLQASSADPMPLGRHLVREGHLTEEQHSKVLEKQRWRLAERDPATRAPKGDILFGRLAVREGLATEEQVNAALREQGRDGDRRTLGEVLLARGVLTQKEVEWLLGLQSKWIMRCPRCATTYTVHSTSKNPRKASCPRCRASLEPLEEQTNGAVEAELETSVRQMPLSRSDQKGACRICRHTVVSMPASDGRVECLKCHVRFVP